MTVISYGWYVWDLLLTMLFFGNFDLKNQTDGGVIFQFHRLISFSCAVSGHYYLAVQSSAVAVWPYNTGTLCQDIRHKELTNK